MTKQPKNVLICTSTDSKEKDKDLKEMLKIDGKDVYMFYSNPKCPWTKQILDVTPLQPYNLYKIELMRTTLPKSHQQHLKMFLVKKNITKQLQKSLNQFLCPLEDIEKFSLQQPYSSTALQLLLCQALLSRVLDIIYCQKSAQSSTSPNTTTSNHHSQMTFYVPIQPTSVSDNIN